MNDPSNQVCSVCAKEHRGKPYIIKNGDICCPDCYNKAAKAMPIAIDTLGADAIRAIVLPFPIAEDDEQEVNLEEPNKTARRVRTRRSTPDSSKKFSPIVAWLIFLFVISSLFILIIPYISDTPILDPNARVIRETISEDLGNDIYKAMKATSCINSSNELAKNDIIRFSENEYEIYTGIFVRVIIKNNSFKLYANNHEYGRSSTLLLYDSEDPDSKVVISSLRFDTISTSQRKYLASKIDFDPKEKADISESSYFSIDITNNSHYVIENIYIEFEPKYVFETMQTFSGSTNASGDSYFAMYNGDTIQIKVYSSIWKLDEDDLVKVIVYIADGPTLEYKYDECKYFLD